jgi:phasin
MNTTTKSKSSHVGDQLRDTMETIAERSKEMPETIGAAANEATVSMQNSFSTMLYGMQEYNSKVVEFAQANTKSQVEFVQRLAGVKSPAEFVVISNDYAHHQLTTLTEQTQELAALAQKVAASTTEPLKTRFAKVPFSPV